MDSVVLAPDFETVRQRTAAAGCRFVALEAGLDRLGAHEDVDQTVNVIRHERARMAVVDSYRLSAADLATVRDAAGRLTVFDDQASSPTPADVLINGAIGADRVPYRSTTEATQFLLGPAYAVLQPEYEVEPPERQAAAASPQVLVAVGGSDPHRLLPRIVEWLDALPAAFTMTVVVGPFSDGWSVPLESRHVVRIVDGPPSLHPLLVDAELVVCAAGQTLYEAAATGTPAVAMELFDNQRPTLHGFVSAGTALSAGSIDDSGLAQRLQNAVSALLADSGLRRKQSLAGRTLVDGHGAARVAREVVRAS